jgi:hypothetical protein
MLLILAATCGVGFIGFEQGFQFQNKTFRRPGGNVAGMQVNFAMVRAVDWGPVALMVVKELSPKVSKCFQNDPKGGGEAVWFFAVVGATVIVVWERVVRARRLAIAA